jgi:hypothetical protein
MLKLNEKRDRAAKCQSKVDLTRVVSTHPRNLVIKGSE